MVTVGVIDTVAEGRLDVTASVGDGVVKSGVVSDKVGEKHPVTTKSKNIGNNL